MFCVVATHSNGNVRVIFDDKNMCLSLFFGLSILARSHSSAF
jgi:hypothetical protein